MQNGKSVTITGISKIEYPKDGSGCALIYSSNGELGAVAPVGALVLLIKK